MGLEVAVEGSGDAGNGSGDAGARGPEGQEDAVGEGGVDVVAIGPHPDDIELFCGGTVARLARSYRVVVLDLTRGERASNGSVAERALEAAAAAEVLGVLGREQLGLPDGGLDGRDARQVEALVRALRRLKPKIVLAPHEVARHPDHAEAGRLVARAAFLAGVGGYLSEVPRHRVREVVYYLERVEVEPSFAVDISEFMDVKQRAVNCHASQLRGVVPTMVGSAASGEALRARDARWGAQLGVAAAEAFVVGRLVAVADPVAAFGGEGGGPTLFPARRGA